RRRGSRKSQPPTSVGTDLSATEIIHGLTSASTMHEMTARSPTPRWITTQIGAHEHYTVPRALHQSDRLNTLFTDFWAGPLIRGAARCLPVRGLCSLAARYHCDLREVESWNLRALAWATKGCRESDPSCPYFGFIKMGQKFASAM